jgi:uncharacterized protein
VKVVFDTNVLISAYTARGLSADLFRLVLAEHEVLTGEVNLAEFRRVLVQRLMVPPSEAIGAERELREQTIIPKPSEPSALKIRDDDDAWVLASAVVGSADLLVTGDKDLLDVAGTAPIPIVTPRDCWQKIRG